MCFQAQALGQAAHEVQGIQLGVVVRLALVGKQARVGPARLAIGAPGNRQSPARQLFTGVPLALAKVQKPALAIPFAQAQHQFTGQAAFAGAQGVGVPFGGVTVAHGDERRLTAHGQAHIM